MSVVTVNNVFSEEQLQTLHNIINHKGMPTSELHSEFPHDHTNCDPVPEVYDPTTGIDRTVGRIQTGRIDSYLPDDIKKRMLEIVDNILGEPCAIAHALHSIYSNKYGTPNLPPHLDGTTHDLIINFQLSSNTKWDLGINHDLYSLENNEALVFNANTEIHWRPHKVFSDGEYVQIIFIRCHKVGSESNLSYMYNTPSINIDKIFSDANKVRDSL
jgi:hypothetical protein